MYQLPKPFMLLGDFNTHHNLWDRTTDVRGNVVANLLDKHDLIVLNDGRPTLLSTLGTLTSPDVSLVSAQLALSLSWDVDDSDAHEHYPIFIRMNGHKDTNTKRPTWKIKSANWDLFESILLMKDLPSYSTGSEGLEMLTETILKAAEQSMSKSDSQNGRRKVPWWNSDIAEAVRTRRRKHKAYKRNSTPENRVEYSKAKAVARKMVLQAKTQSWHDFVKKINVNTSISEMWSSIRKISGKYSSNQLKALKTHRGIINDPTCIANEMATTLETIYSLDDYPLSTRKHRNNIENLPILSEEDSNDPLNSKFSMEELETALCATCGSSTGLNEIHIDMLRRLPVHLKCDLLNIFNSLWTSILTYGDTLSTFL
jgi:hypothetical protein